MATIKRNVRSRRSGMCRVVCCGLVFLVGYFAWWTPTAKSLPLCRECWEIVQSMKHVYVPAGEQHHDENPGTIIGARNEHGSLEPFYFDETSLHHNPEPLDILPTKLQQICEKRDDAYRVFHEKIIVDMEYDKQAKAKERRRPRPRILCIVYAIESDHHPIPLIRQTWGSKCDGFVVVSNKTDLTLGAIDVPHEGAEEYNNKWQKIRSLWAFVYENYYQRYDWFFLAQTDSFLMIENLRYYLESDEIARAANGGRPDHGNDKNMQVPLYLGRRFALSGNQSEIYNTSGPGYVLNKAALKSLITDVLPQMDEKLLHARTFSHDTLLAKAFRKIGIYPYPTQDEKGGERFMPFRPQNHYPYKFPADPDSSRDWYAKYSLPGVKEGLDHFATRSIGFHYVHSDEMAQLYALAYGLCPKEGGLPLAMD